MSLYFSICAPSGKFLCADALLDSSIHALKEASEKAAGTFHALFQPGSMHLVRHDGSERRQNHGHKPSFVRKSKKI